MDVSGEEITVEVINDITEIELTAAAATDVAVDETEVNIEIAGEPAITEEIREETIDVEIHTDEIVIQTGEDGAAIWGSIDGTLSDQTDLQEALDGKAAVNHDHDDRYYTEAETDTLLAGKSDISHRHDDRYYTKAENDHLLAGKAALHHVHDDRYYTEAESDALLAGKAALNHDHDDRYYTEAETDTLLAGKAAANHNHDDRYYTEAETDNLLAGKAAANHNHDDRYYTEAETDTLLAGKASASHTHDDRYYTEAETDTLLAGKAAASHTHDDRYYTEAETDALIAGINNGKANASSIADLYDPEEQYELGDIVMKDGDLKQFTIGIRPLETEALTASGSAVRGDLISYETDLFEVRAEVDWHEATVEDAYQFFLMNPNVFRPVPATAYDPAGSYSVGDIVYDVLGNFYTITGGDELRDITVEDLLAGKAAADHTHDDRYYTEAETDTLLAGKAAASHTHDDRYYTEAETDALLAGKEILYYTGQAVTVATSAQIMRIPASGTDDKISTDTIVLECVFAKPANITTDVSWTSYAGYIAFSGTCTAATTADIILGKKGN